MSHDTDDRELSRRELIASAAFVPLVALAGVGSAAAQTAARSALSESQMKILESFIERLIPADNLGPSAAEAGAQIYIDRVLAESKAAEKASFVDALAAVDAFAERSQGAPFARLSPEKRDMVIGAIENGSAEGVPNAQQFFARVRRLTLEGMFGDPYYGGNRNFAGWDLIHYPGPRQATSSEDQKMNVEPKPFRVSAWGTQYGH